MTDVPDLDTTDAVNKTHDQNTDVYLATDVTTTIYVDNNRTDGYTANGSLTRPFKTIKAACTAVDSIAGLFLLDSRRYCGRWDVTILGWLCTI